MHYIGKIESFDEDFARLQKAMESKVVNYSPAQRASLIPPRDDSNISRNIPEGESILHRWYFHDVTPNNILQESKRLTLRPLERVGKNIPSLNPR